MEFPFIKINRIFFTLMEFLKSEYFLKLAFITVLTLHADVDHDDLSFVIG